MTNIENQEIKALREELTENNRHLQKLDSRIEKLTDIIAGNNLTRDGGLFRRVENVEKWRRETEGKINTSETTVTSKKDLLKTWGTWIAISATILYNVIDLMVKIINKK